MDKLYQEEVDELISDSSTPNISLYMPTSKKGGDEVNKMKIRFKNLLNEVKEKLNQKYSLSKKEMTDLLSPLENLNSDREFWLKQSLGLAIFLSPNLFKLFRLPLKFKKETYVEKFFNLKQIIPELFEDRRYYVLALSRKRNKFFRCTKEDIREVNLDELPDGINDTLKYDDPEKTIQYHSGSTGTNSSAIYHGQGVTNEDNVEDLLRYLREINRVISDYLQKDNSPLVIMCVEELFPLYQRANSYSNLLDEFVKGNPDKLKPEDILSRSWPVVEPYIKNYWWEAVKRFNNLKDTERTSNKLQQIVTDSYYGKVDYLLLKHSKERKEGIYYPEEDKIKYNVFNERNYDLYNYAVINTIKQGGEVYVLEEEQLPGEVKIGAVYRY